MSKIDIKRNKDLIFDYCDHKVVFGRRVYRMSVVEVARKYNITDARLQQILTDNNVSKRSSYNGVEKMLL